jgi:hypothetical protein
VGRRDGAATALAGDGQDGGSPSPDRRMAAGAFWFVQRVFFLEFLETVIGNAARARGWWYSRRSRRQRAKGPRSKVRTTSSSCGGGSNAAMFHNHRVVVVDAKNPAGATDSGQGEGADTEADHDADNTPHGDHVSGNVSSATIDFVSLENESQHGRWSSSSTTARMAKRTFKDR